jgi:hypothetical protein
VLTLTTLRSHDQYNTTVYGLDDRYRGVSGRRDVLFISERDLAARMAIRNHRQREQTANLRAVATSAGRHPKPAAGVVRPSDL